MHDIRAIRDDFKAWETAMLRRSLSADQRAQIASILDLDKQARALQTQRQDAEAGRNAASKAIGAAKAQKNDAEAARLMEEVARLKGVIETSSADEEKIAGELRSILESLPNVPGTAVAKETSSRVFGLTMTRVEFVAAALSAQTTPCRMLMPP